MNFDAYFMSMAYFVAMKSKDKSTRIGAVIVGEDNEVVSVGYNGLCRGVIEREERQEKPAKYFLFEHGERNAIYNSARIGVSTKGCKMYTQGVPCSDCARGIIQAGIKEVIVHAPWNEKNGQKWKESAEYSKQMFNEATVYLRYYKGPIISTIEGLNDGTPFDLTNFKD